jgi:iron complex outermembrane receptor protein
MQKLIIGCTLYLMVVALPEVFGQAMLSGTVRNAQGQPLAGANIWLAEMRKGTAADENGVYRLTELAPGAYTLQVSYLGYATDTRIISISSGTTEKREDIALEEYSYQVDELVVRATRSERLTPMTFLNLSEQQLKPHNLGQDVPFLLQWTPSVVVTSDAGNGVGYTGIRIRGTDPTRINITINGIPLNDAESQQVYWVNMPDFASSTADVQIQRGVGSSTNGAGAFGATINLNTSNVQHDPYGEINVSAGSFNTWKRNIEFGSGLLGKRFTLDGRLSKITSDGYIDRASSNLESYYLSGAYIGDRSMLRLITFSGHERTYQAWYGVPPDLVNDWATRTFNPAGTEKPGDPYENEVDDYRQTHYQLLFNQQLSPSLNVNAALHYTRGQGFYEQYKADEAPEDYGLQPILQNGRPLTTDLVRRLWLDNHFYGGLFSLQYAWRGVSFNAGGAIHRYEGLHFGELVWAQFASNSFPGHRYYENDGLKQDVNLYGKALVPLSDILHAYADLQVRGVDYLFLGYDNEGRNVDQEARHRFFNPKMGFTFAPDARTTAYASFAIANREPNRDDYVQSTPESRPRPERLYDTEIGYRYAGTTAGWEINGYYMYYRDQLALNGQINDVGAYTRVNVPESYRLGIELSGAWKPTSLVNLQGNLTLSRNKIRVFEDFLDDYVSDPQTGETIWKGQSTVTYRNTDLSFSPNLIAGFECAFTPFNGNRKIPFGKDFEIAWMSRWIGRQFIDNRADPENALAAYSFTNLRLRFTTGGKSMEALEFTFLLQNLFNAQFSSNAWSYRYRYDDQTIIDQGFFPQAGRNFLMGIRVRF